MSVLETAEELTEELMSELDGRSLFNGVDDDVLEEIKEAIFDIVAKSVI